MPQIFNYVILAVCIPLIAIALYIFPTVAAFENKTMTLITNAFYFAVKHIGYAIAVAVITILPMTMTLVDAKLFPVYLLIWLMVGFSLTAYADSPVYVETVQTVFQRGRRRTSLCRYRTGSVCFLTKKQQRNERYRVWNGLSIMRQKKYLT